MMGWTYDLGVRGQVLRTVVEENVPNSVWSTLNQLVEKWSVVPEIQALLVRGYARGPVGAFFRGAFVRAGPVAELRALCEQELSASDVLRISITDPEGFGFALGALVPVGRRVVVRDRATLSRNRVFSGPHAILGGSIGNPRRGERPTGEERT